MSFYRYALMAVFLAGSATASANDLSYSYIEGGVNYLDPDGLDSGYGFGVNGQFAFANRFFAWGAFSNADVDIPNSNVEVDVQAFAIGAGYYHPVTENTDFVGRLGLSDVEVGVADDDGYVASVAFRSQWTPERAEASVGAAYTDVGNGEASLFVEGVYQFNNTIGLSSKLQFGEDGNAAFLGVRASF